ncbi:MAG: cache domain-containing protein [Syntrophobacteraceae bacterium]|nr:cache domain-containing protein [Desulfobacteraceae bacterium]
MKTRSPESERDSRKPEKRSLEEHERSFRVLPASRNDLEFTRLEVHGEKKLPAITDLADVRYWAIAAIRHLKACGREAALAEFSNPVGLFVKDTMYIFALDKAGRVVAHGSRADYVGMDFYGVEDREGYPFVKFIVDTANEHGCGWVEYRGGDPGPRGETLRLAYFQRHEETIVCCEIPLPA